MVDKKDEVKVDEKALKGAKDKARNDGLKDMSVVELKALIFDREQVIKIEQNNIRVLYTELQSRLNPVNKVEKE
jgi:hypothetical protein